MGSSSIQRLRAQLQGSKLKHCQLANMGKHYVLLLPNSVQSPAKAWQGVMRTTPGTWELQRAAPVAPQSESVVQQALRQGLAHTFSSRGRNAAFWSTWAVKHRTGTTFQLCDECSKLGWANQDIVIMTGED